MKSSRRGMNLLEVTIGLLVIGLLAAIAMPRYTRTLQTNQLNAAAATVASTIGYVRRVALNQGRTTTLDFDGVQDVLASPDVEFVEKAGTPISIDLKAEYDTSIELSSDFDGHTTLSFDLEGAPLAGGNSLQSGSVTLTCGAISRTIHVLPGLGEVSFESPNGGGGGTYP